MHTDKATLTAGQLCSSHTLCQLEDVLLPVNDLERALRRQLSYVACVEPAILVQNLHHTFPSFRSGLEHMSCNGTPLFSLSAHVLHCLLTNKQNTFASQCYLPIRHVKTCLVAQHIC